MALTWDAFEAAFNRLLPEGSTRRKLAQIVAIVLLFEGISVILLFSYAGLAVGIFSVALGLFVLLMLSPTKKPSEVAEGAPAGPPARKEDPPGIKLLDWIMQLLGSSYVLLAIGAAVIGVVLTFNWVLSPNPEMGDVDTLALLFGGMLMAYPFLVSKYKTEAAFTLLFLGIVVVLLVAPAAVSAVSESAGEDVGGWYVHYMLAAPFAWILDHIGIPADSVDNMVMITFKDGTEQWLSISAYCAGMYSFSIFVAAFLAFVLVFERLPARIMVPVLAIGLIAAYLGNLFRMTVIGIVGYYNGLDALLWTHENAGWIIFLVWSSLFWYLLIRYADARQRGPRVSRNE